MVETKHKAKMEAVDHAWTFASPCFMHAVDPAYLSIYYPTDGRQRPVKRWCKAERARLIGDCMATDAAARLWHDTRVSESLEATIGRLDGPDIRMDAVVNEDRAFDPASVPEDGAA